jgi:hypothetical protein
VISNVRLPPAQVRVAIVRPLSGEYTASPTEVLVPLESLRNIPATTKDVQAALAQNKGAIVLMLKK